MQAKVETCPERPVMSVVESSRDKGACPERSRGVADVLNRLGDGIENIGLNSWKLRTLTTIKLCRTAAMGGHVDACDACGNISISYNSCRNHHCRIVEPPNAKAIKKRIGYPIEWLSCCQCGIFTWCSLCPMPSTS